MPRSSSNVYAFPEVMTIVVVLQSTTSLNDCSDWIAQLLIETVLNLPERNVIPRFMVPDPSTSALSF